jgi:hypothetical protein
MLPPVTWFILSCAAAVENDFPGKKAKEDPAAWYFGTWGRFLYS